MGEMGAECWKRPTGGISGNRIFSLWLGAKPDFVKARDWYLRIAENTEGPVGLCEPHGPVLEKYLDSAGIRAKAIGPATGGDCDGWEGSGAGAAGIAEAGERCRLAAIPFGGIEAFLQRQQRSALFKSLHGILAEGGRLVFDAKYWGVVPERLVDGLQRLALDQRRADGSSLLLWETWRKAGASGGAVELGLGLETVSADGVVSRKKYARFPVAVLNPEEIEADARDAGFIIDGVYGGFSFEPLGETSPRQVWLFRKAEAGETA